MWPRIRIPNVNPFRPCIVGVNNRFSRQPLVMAELNTQNQSTGNGLQGSVPSSPEAEIDDFTSSYDALEMETREIIDTFFKSFAGLPHSKNGEKKQVLATMKRIVDSMEVKHRLTYNGLIKWLNLEQKGEDVSFIKIMATKMFSDGITNWGRIASLLTFGAILCKYQNDRGHSNYLGLVVEEISSYLLTEQRDWLLKNKAWDGFVDFFHVPDPMAAVRNTLIAVGIVGAFGTGLAYLISRIR